MANSRLVFWFMFGFLLPRTISQLTEEDWGDWSPCSRSCGVGVSYQDRKCLDVTDDGSCPEPRRKYSTCNLQDCPAQSVDYRYEQCASYNSRTLQGKKYKWVPYIPAHDICALNCMPKGEYFYYRWAAKVVDGTKCSPDSYDICVNGKCESLGCDLIMHSKAKEDKCRVCNGQGNNCRTITGEFTEVGDGYKEIVAIPASATNIVISENAPASHFLALADSKGKFFLNGDYDVTNPRTYKIAGSLFRYERASSGKEEIRSLGPILESIHAHILLIEGYNNPGVSYEFSIPKSVDIIEPANFSWKASSYGICSATCAGGYQYRKLFCIRDRDNKEVPPYQCDATAKPATKQACNTQPCPPRWFISRWTTCSTTCGQGKQVRRVHCENEVLGGDSAMISDERCPTPKPINMRVCSQQRYCPGWSVSAWSQCSVSCGEGIVTRQARCGQVSSTTNNIMYLADESCDLRTKPTTNSRCNPGPCTVKWTASDWSQCYPKCGRGISTRMVYCVSVTDDNQKYPDTLCDKRTRPASRKECSSSKACPAMWHGSQWSRCTASCGVGMQMRNVICAVRESSMLRIVSREQCKASYVMSSVRKCSTKPCQAGWYIYPWQPCSKSCGIGIRRRLVKCFADSKEVPSERWCDKKTKPTEVNVCTIRSCQLATSNPQEGRTTERPTTERRTTERPTTERRTTKRPTTERRTTERPTTERRTTERPTTERRTTERPTTERGTTERPTTERRTTERPTTERRTTERPTTERTTERPTTERRTTERPTTERRTTERPTTERRTTERPTTERRTTERPTTERRTTERPTTERTTERPSTERRTTERPTTERRTTERPTTERTTERPTTERRTTEKKTTERRTTKKKTTEKRFTKADTTSQRMTKRPTTQPREVTQRYPEEATTTRRTRLRITAKPTTIKPIPAKIVEGPRNKVRFLGAEVHLRCRATGIPEPKVSWRKGMYPVSSLGERYQILSEGTLHIDKVRPEDEGTYTCFAGNFVGSMDRRDANLQVIVPVTVKVRPASKYEVSAGERVVLECNAQGRPAPKAYWYKDDRVFYINTQRISTTSQRITINSAQVRDSGQYKCRAEHEYSQAADSVVLKVKEVKPVIPTTLPVCEDTTLFSCATVKRAHGCGSRYFKRACCVTCGPSS